MYNSKYLRVEVGVLEVRGYISYVGIQRFEWVRDIILEKDKKGKDYKREIF